MKNPIRFGFLPALLPGCLLPLLALLLAACFNPITVIPPKQNDLNVDPFTIDILIGNDGSARSVAGPDSTRIKGDIRNFMQLIVVDNTGNIVALAEARREDDDDTDGLLSINSIAFGPTYHFLLLMGHWEHDGNYQYYDDPQTDFRSPTLLAAGLKKQQVTGSGTITITMWPIVVDTVFTSGDLATEPVVNTGQPQEVTLHPVAWNVTWTIKRGLMGNGLTDLVKKIPYIPVNDENPLALKRITTLVRVGTEVQEKSKEDVELSRTKNVITQSLKDYTEGFGHIGETGSVNFRLEYVPFNLTGEEENPEKNPEKNPWTEYDLESVFDLRGNNVPVWIIRNRINDKAQDDNTDFTAFHNIGNPGTGPSGGEKPNGNGAVRYRIAPNISAEENGLKIENGKFLGPVDSETPDISFTTSGYKDTAEVYYAVVLHTDQSVPPDYSDYTLLGDPVEANEWQIPINLGDDQVGKDYDVYVIIYKDGEVSAPVVINTLRGGVEGDWIWGDEPCKSYYIASAGNNGNDNNAGTKVAPLATVQKALEKLAADYTSPKWPNKAGSDEVSGGIIILDTVKVSNEIPIDGSVGYPSIILSDDSVMSGGRLQAQSGIGKKNLLKLTNNARVTLEGGLILEGLGQGAAVKIRGVYVDSSTFTMNGGKISGNTTSSNDKGGGVYVGTDSIFTIEWRGNIRQFRRLRRRGIRRRRYVYHERRGNIRQFRHQRRRRGIPLHRIFHPHKDRRYHLRV